ncbi:MAG: ribosome maturation factor RimM [Gammaproteobacteria bacterium]|nr:ribosome maturation factor RimM [Gammaproteobacteria bacterium]
MGGDATDLLVMGRVSGVFGVRGWVKVWSYSDPRENLLEYPVWRLRLAGGWRPVRVLEGRAHGKALVARLEGCGDREAARALIGADIAVRREELPLLPPGEYYWGELEGLRVETLEGRALGVVDHLIETGANDVLVVRGERERLIPYLPGEVVREVDLEQGTLRVDWDPEF